MTSTRDFLVALALKPLLARTAGRRPRRGGHAARGESAAGGAPVRRSRRRREAPARAWRLVPALVLLGIGVVAMVPFESTLSRVIGVLALFGFVVAGAFAVADPRWLADAPPLGER